MLFIYNIDMVKFINTFNENKYMFCYVYNN